MLGIWADEPANEYKEEEVFQVMEAFANHNKDYFKLTIQPFMRLLPMFQQIFPSTLRNLVQLLQRF